MKWTEPWRRQPIPYSYILVSGYVLSMMSLLVMSLDINTWNGKETFPEESNVWFIPNKKKSKSSCNGDGRSSLAPSPSPFPTPIPGSTSPKRRRSFKQFFKPTPKSPNAVDGSSPPVTHCATHNSSPLTISHHNSPLNTPTSSPARSPVLPRPHGRQERLVKSNSHLNIKHTASSVSSNGDDNGESSDSNWSLCHIIHCYTLFIYYTKDKYFMLYVVVNVM